MEAIKNLVLDMDGVLWHGDTPMPGLAAFFDTLRQKNVNFVLATNNAGKTAVMYTEKLAQLGVDIPPSQILNSAETTALYLSQRYEAGTAVYIIGEKGLHDALVAQGFHIITPEEVANGAAAPLVVAGIHRQVTYNDFAMGTLLVNNGANFIGTNPDPSYPSELGPLPGAGSILAVLETATGIKPTIIGKPQPTIFLEAVKRLDSTPANTAMVGDRLTTDIAGGQRAELHTILVLSGVTSREQVQSSAIKPDFIFDDITDLANHLEDHS